MPYVYNSGIYYLNSINKQEILWDWQIDLLFAAGALGTGVNIKSIKFVIYLSLCKGSRMGKGKSGGKLSSTGMTLSGTDKKEEIQYITSDKLRKL